MNVPHLLAEDLDNVVEHVGGAWDELRGARLFISGGTGFFGAWMLHSFQWANSCKRLGARAVVLTRDSASFCRRVPALAADEAIAFWQGDIQSFAFPEGKFTHVLHLATPSGARPGEIVPAALLDLIVEGTRRMLAFSRQAGAIRFLLASSGAVYGPQPASTIHIDEDDRGGPDPTDVRSSYGEGKRMAELLCALCQGECGLAPLIARGFAFVGPYLPLDVHFAIGNFIRDGLRGGPIQVSGDGTPLRSYLYAGDLAAWLWTILLKGQPCRPYNVGAETPYTIAEVAARVADYFHTGVRIARTPPAGAPVQRYVPSTRRARQELGLDAWTSLDEAIARTARWHRS